MESQKDKGSFAVGKSSSSKSSNIVVYTAFLGTKWSHGGVSYVSLQIFVCVLCVLLSTHIIRQGNK